MATSQVREDGDGLDGGGGAGGDALGAGLLACG